MLRHLPEGVTLFENCGYARTPVHPTVNDEICLACQSDAPALLEIEGHAGEARQSAPRQWTLPPQHTPRRLRYRFVTADESTPWYEVEVLREIEIRRPISVGHSWAEVYPEVYLSVTLEEGRYAFRLTGQKPCAAPVPEVCFGNPLWTLALPEGRQVQCEAVTVSLRADGSIARYGMELRGMQKHVYGTGERFDAVDQQGRARCGQVTEHFTRQGPWSYLPVPVFLTDGGFGCFRDTAGDVDMRFGETLRVASAYHPGLTDYLLPGVPGEQLRAYITLTGEAALPPEWAFGLWISANGWNCDAEVDEQLRQLKANNYPASVMVLEAWSDESTFYRWSSAWQDPAAMVRRVRDAGLHLVLWQIPVLKALRDSPDRERVARDREEAIRQGWVVRHRDGAPYIIPERWFEGSLLPDFTNPAACDWWFGKRNHLIDAGVEGFKTDGGEFLFGSDVLLADGTPGDHAHNLYPLQYERAYHAWMKKRGLDGVLFSRAGYAGAQTVPIHWAGDQLSTWDELQSQLNAGLSAGLSGVLFWSFDIGGFAGELPGKELYLRATALGCFSPVMQWHAEPRSGQFYATHDAAFNNDRSPWNLAEKTGDPQLLEISAAFARIRERLRPYLWAEAQHCVRAARPMMAHLCLDFPGDERALACHDEYMLGRQLLVAPVIAADAGGRSVYLPDGQWQHYFTDERYVGGRTYDLHCPLDRALVFKRWENG